jgi:ABC-type glycerol-3-phosphate transport system substrate-binding protein
MRWFIAGLVALWCVLSAVAYLVILPEEGEGEAMLRAFTAVASDVESGSAQGDAAERLRPVYASVREAIADEFGAAAPPDLHSIWALPDEQRAPLVAILRDEFREAFGFGPGDAPTLIWSTDDNPARQVQCQLFREWHLRTYGEPVDIRTDPSNRDITKAIVQCVAGRGPDLIESYGPEQLRQFVEAGVALDVTDEAREQGFALDSVFDAAKPSMAVRSPAGVWAQYAFPCNVGYTVLFFHRDLFEEAGVPMPRGPWSIEEATDSARALIDYAQANDTRRFGIMNLGAWDMGVAAGGRFFNTSATASFYNTPETVAGLSAYHDMIYRDDVSPTPAEAASVAATGGANMNAGAEAASASSLFAAKVAAMYVGGRWEYVSLAERNRDRVILPALARALEDDTLSDERRALLIEARDNIRRDVLLPMSDEAHAAMDSVLTDEDRAGLVQLGVAHVPTAIGAPTYNAGARVAVVNRSSENTEFAVRFLRFLASADYNEQINQTYDSICGVPAFTLDEDGISGPPRALPGLEAMDSPVFVEAMNDWARSEQISPFITRTRLGELVGPVLEDLQNDALGPAEAARLIERRVNDQIAANLRRDLLLRERWEAITGVTFDRDPDVYLPDQLDGTEHSRAAFRQRMLEEIERKQQQAEDYQGAGGPRVNGGVS